MQDTELGKRLNETLESIKRAAQDAGRGSGEVRLVAVSKMQSVEAVKELINFGQKDFGENYVQEAREKMDSLPQANWHFIGRLQSNKAKFLPGYFCLIHTVDRLKLAQALRNKAKTLNILQPVLLQVNLAQEEQKGGIGEKDLLWLVEQILQLDGLKLNGLMCMPPFFEDGEKSRPYFARLRELKAKLEEKFFLSLKHLSMGMTADYRQAVEEGATLVRIGTQIFGHRSCKIT